MSLLSCVEFQPFDDWDQAPLWRDGHYTSGADGWPERHSAPMQAFMDKMDALRSPGETMVRKTAIDPVKMPAFLSGIQLVECVRKHPHAVGDPKIGELRFLIRVVGTDIVTSTGFDYTGRYMDEFHPPENIPIIERVYGAIVAERRPQYWRSCEPVTKRLDSRFERIIFPLMADCGEISHLIGYWNYDVPRL